jgi:hypothetical protein
MPEREHRPDVADGLSAGLDGLPADPAVYVVGPRARKRA